MIERNHDESSKSIQWLNRGDKKFMSVMFVEATENDKLLKMFKETEETHKISESQRIKFVSKSGIKLKHILERKDPFSSQCIDNECKPCVNTVGRDIKN